MNTDLSRDTLIKLYVDQNLTDAEIAAQLKVNSWNIVQLRKKYGIAGINARQREFLRRPPMLPLSARQNSILRGMLLGDGCLKPSGPRAYLSVAHSEKQKQYVEWIYGEFMSFCPHPPIQEIHHKKYIMHSLASETREDLSKIREIIYTPKKTITDSYFCDLDEIGLAVWYMDDGSLGYINKTTLSYGLATNSYSEFEQEILKRILKKNFGVETELRPSVSQLGKQQFGKQQFSLTVVKTSFDRFTEIIKRNIIPSMSYKLPGSSMVESMLKRSKAHLSKEFLIRMYEDEKMTQNQIAIKTGMCISTIRKHMNLWDISGRSREASQLGGRNSSVVRSQSGQFVQGVLSKEQEEQSVLLFDEIRKSGIEPKTIDPHHAIGILERLCGIPILEAEEIPYCRIGIELCTAFFPHIIEMASNKSLSPLTIFRDNVMLMDCIRRTIRYSKRATLASVKQGLKTYRNNRSVTVFPPMWGKQTITMCMPIREHLKVLDFSCGFGGRMLGAYATGKVGLYVGIDPLSKNIESSNMLANVIRRHAEISSRKFETKFILGCAENEIKKIKEHFDVVITSPPYFNKERYSDDQDQSQCYVRFTDYKEWVDCWLKKVIVDAFDRLNGGGVMILFASDFAKHPVGTDCSRIMGDIFGEQPKCIKFVVPSVEYMRKTGVKKFETAWIATKYCVD